MKSAIVGLLLTAALLPYSKDELPDTAVAATQPVRWSEPTAALGESLVCSIAVMDNGTVVASRGDVIATIWSADSEPRAFAALFGSVHASPDGKHVAIQESEHTITIRSYPEMRLQNQVKSGERISGLAGIISGGKSVYWYSGNAIYRGRATGQLDMAVKCVARFDESSVKSAWSSPEGRYIAAVLGLTGVVHVLDSHNGYRDVAVDFKYAPLIQVVFSGDGDDAFVIAVSVALMSSSSELMVLDLRSHTVTSISDGKDRKMFDAAISGDGRLIATTCVNGTTQVWDWRARQVVHEWQTGFGTAVAFDPKGKYVVVGTESGDVVKRMLNPVTTKSP